MHRGPGGGGRDAAAGEEEVEAKCVTAEEAVGHYPLLPRFWAGPKGPPTLGPGWYSGMLQRY